VTTDAWRHVGEGQHANTIQCYVAEVDPLARHLLTDAIGRDESTTIVGTVGDESRILGELQRTRADAIFVDARMRPDVLRECLSRAGDSCSVVLVSAVAADASHAFANEAADFLLKPFSRARVAAVLERVRRRMQERALVEWADAASVPIPVADALLAVASRGGTDYLPMSAIESIVSSGECAKIDSATGTVETTTPLVDLERRLDASQFVRTHRSAIVNISYARRLQGIGAGGGQLLLQSGKTLPVAKRRMAAVRRALSRRTDHTAG
jgi:two-component system LytT family response regulator